MSYSHAQASQYPQPPPGVDGWWRTSELKLDPRSHSGLCDCALTHSRNRTLTLLGTEGCACPSDSCLDPMRATRLRVASAWQASARMGHGAYQPFVAFSHLTNLSYFVTNRAWGPGHFVASTNSACYVIARLGHPPCRKSSDKGGAPALTQVHFPRRLQ